MEPLEDYDAQALLDDDPKDDDELKEDPKTKTDDEPKTEEKPKEIPAEPPVDLKSEADKLRDENPLADIKDDWEPSSYKELLEKATQVSDYNRHVAEATERDLKATQEKENETRRVEIQVYYDKEVEESVKEGRIPKIKDLKDVEDEGVKVQDKIWQFMLDHNAKCEKDGDDRYKIISFRQALDLYELKEIKLEQIANKKKEEELASKRGGMIGAGGSKSGENKSSGYVRGTTMDEVMSEELQNM